MEVQLKNKDDAILGSVHYDLDPCGDNGYETICEDFRKIDVPKDPSISNPTIRNVNSIYLKFHDEECFMCGDVDMDIHTITIKNNTWKAVFNDDSNSFDDDVVDDEWRNDDITSDMTGYVDEKPLSIWSPIN